VEQLKVGTLIIDHNKIGVITKVITSGTLNTDNDIINWRNNYEIYYNDGSFSIIGEATLHRLIKRGEVEVL
tara:strand:- start:726 stop:938 length:213 start_codon:yes stop_codon:yes gene_type:complete